jgi:hypothetical protein
MFRAKCERATATGGFDLGARAACAAQASGVVHAIPFRGNEHCAGQLCGEQAETRRQRPAHDREARASAQRVKIPADAFAGHAAIAARVAQVSAEYPDALLLAGVCGK